MIENLFNELVFVLFILMMIPASFVSLFIMLIAFNAEAKRKQRSQEAKEREKAAESVAASVVVSKDDGRVIAQVAPEPQPVLPAAAPPPKDEGNTAAKVVKVVAGRAAAAVAKHYLRRWLFGR